MSFLLCVLHLVTGDAKCTIGKAEELHQHIAECLEADNCTELVTSDGKRWFFVYGEPK